MKQASGDENYEERIYENISTCQQLSREQHKENVKKVEYKMTLGNWHFSSNDDNTYLYALVQIITDDALFYIIDIYIIINYY